MGWWDLSFGHGRPGVLQLAPREYSRVVIPRIIALEASLAVRLRIETILCVRLISIRNGVQHPKYIESSPWSLLALLGVSPNIAWLKPD